MRTSKQMFPIKLGTHMESISQNVFYKCKSNIGEIYYKRFKASLVSMISVESMACVLYNSVRHQGAAPGVAAGLPGPAVSEPPTLQTLLDAHRPAATRQDRRVHSARGPRHTRGRAPVEVFKECYT